MLRSFDHAAWTSVFRFTEADPVAFDQLLAPALAWRDASRAAFMEEYRVAMAGCPSWPGEPAAEQLLRLCSVSRLFEEVLREAGRRPAMLRVPLHGLRELARPSAASRGEVDENGQAAASPAN